MTSPSTINTLAISELERRDDRQLLALSLEERGKLLAAVCRDAEAIEASRGQAGLPPSRPAPWPKSTWDFLAEAARRVPQG
jgi:hypothetical protein